MNRRSCLIAALLVGAVLAAPAGGVSIPERTERVSGAPSGSADGASTRPAISPGGELVAFESVAANLTADGNGAVKDVFLRDTGTGTLSLLSTGRDGSPADGPSEAPALAGGGIVVFASAASNLVEGDTNGVSDVFIRRPGAPIERVSVTSAGGQADGASFEPDVSRDGRFVVFTSRATNLVAHDANPTEDVFIRDLRDRTTRRLSERDGASAGGRSRLPAISPDGTHVSFASTGDELVTGDTNGVADVFLAEVRTGAVRRVSVNSRERQQNRAVEEPFVIVSDVSDGGRYVAFDSDATNLAARDRLHTDVFVRDVRRGVTSLASLGRTGKQGNNDSYYPSISRDGRYVAFTSFASNLVRPDARGEDLFVFDRSARVGTLLTVTSRGGTRGREASAQLLRRVALADSARSAAFTSTANLASGQTAVVQDVYVRRAAPPEGRIVSGPRGTVRSRRPRLRLSADDPRATFVCRLDGRSFVCPRNGRLPRLSRGRHRLVVRATGPGMLPDPTPPVRTFRVGSP